MKPLESRSSRLVTEIDCSSQTFNQSKTLSKRIIPESLVTRPAGQGERRLWERDCLFCLHFGMTNSARAQYTNPLTDASMIALQVVRTSFRSVWISFKDVRAKIFLR